MQTVASMDQSRFVLWSTIAMWSALSITVSRMHWGLHTGEEVSITMIGAFCPWICGGARGSRNSGGVTSEGDGGITRLVG